MRPYSLIYKNETLYVYLSITAKPCRHDPLLPGNVFHHYWEKFKIFFLNLKKEKKEALKSVAQLSQVES